MKYLLALVLISVSYSCLAYESLELDLDSGTTINLTHFPGKGKILLIWLPSERGFGEGYIPVALDLAAMDFDVWAAHLHESYMIPAGRYSLDEMAVEDLVSLIDIAQGQGYQEVFIISSSRGAQLALKMSYQWQQITGRSDYIKGLLLFSPHLIQGKTEIGHQAQYVEIASYSNLPVYLLQAQFSTKYARSREIAAQLQQGGSQIYTHFISGVQGGFHMRPAEDLTAKDLEIRAQLSEIINQATRLLRSSNVTPLDDRLELQLVGPNLPGTAIKAPGLHRYKGVQKTPSLALKDLQGDKFDLAELQGQVVLVNFWATWCGPCVKEIPSLSRLVDGMKDKPFKVLAVNIGESQQVINEFTRSIPVNFNILMDEHGHAVRDWNVYAYPSNFLIDTSGQIQYAYRGALKWDTPAVIDTINQLLISVN